MPTEPPPPDELAGRAREDLAAYKVPRRLVLIDEVQRAANGKPDYAWAKRAALDELEVPA